MKRKKNYEDELAQQEDVYTEEGRESQLNDDEIEDWEAGFMEGYEGGEES